MRHSLLPSNDGIHFMCVPLFLCVSSRVVYIHTSQCRRLKKFPSGQRHWHMIRKENQLPSSQYVLNRGEGTMMLPGFI